MYLKNEKQNTKNQIEIDKKTKETKKKKTTMYISLTLDSNLIQIFNVHETYDKRNISTTTTKNKGNQRMIIQ